MSKALSFAGNLFPSFFGCRNFYRVSVQKSAKFGVNLFRPHSPLSRRRFERYLKSTENLCDRLSKCGTVMHLWWPSGCRSFKIWNIKFIYVKAKVHGRRPSPKISVYK